MEERPWVVWMTLVSMLLSPVIGFTLRTSNGETRVTRLRLMTKAADREALSRRGPAIRENEIAAIFRGVAYGAPTQGFPNVTSTSAIGIDSITTSSPLYVSTTSDEKAAKSFTSTTPYFIENTKPIEKSVKPSNESSLVAKNIHKNSKKDLADKVDINAQSFTNNDGVTDSSHTPSSTSHPIINESNHKTTGQKIDVSKGRGVWIGGHPNAINLHWSLGVAWWLHVYVSVGLFTLLALVSLCLMARVAIATYLLPRPQYLAIHALIFIGSFVRSIYILHESHRLSYLHPVTLQIAVEEFGWPCLTAALAILLAMVLKEWRHPKYPCLSILLYLFTGLHLVALLTTHIFVALMKNEFILGVIVKAISIGWGGVVGIGGMWAVWNVSRDTSSRLTDVQISNSEGHCHNVTHPARLTVTAALTQLLLAGLNLYMLLVPVSPENHNWVWWSCITVSRGLELIIGSTLLTAAALTLARQSSCHIFGTCCQKRTVEIVHPAEIKMIHPMGVYTLQPARPKNEHAQTIAALSLSNAYKEKRDRSSLDYVTSDFQLVWNNHPRQRLMGVSPNSQHISDDNVLQVCSDKAFHDLPNPHILPLKTKGVGGSIISSNAFSSTLPRNRMYASPQSCLPLQEDLKSSQDGGFDYASKSSTLLSGSSGSSKLYSSPQIPLRPSRSWDEISTSHIYEDIMKVRHGSLEEALSDFSDLNSETTSDFIFSDARSPTLVNSGNKHQKHKHVPCYVRANYSNTLSTITSREKESNKNSTSKSSKISSQQSSSKPNSSHMNQHSPSQNFTNHQISTPRSIDEYFADKNSSSNQSFDPDDSNIS